MNKLLPVVRFNNYFGDWDKNKLKNLASFSKGKGYTKSDLTEQGQPIILYGRLYTKYEAVINSVDTFAHLKDNSVLSEGDEVIVPGSGETSEDISRASVIGESGIIIGGDLNVIKPTKKINSIFLALTISNGRQQKELSKRAQGNSVVHLYNSNLKEVSIIFPEKEEQEKIGSFFNKLDKTITLQQQLVNDHKQLKKAMLQKMFPQKGESVPRVRFAGFNVDWAVRTLGEISNMYQPTTIGQSDLLDSGIPVFGANGYIGYYSAENHKNDQVTISARGEKAGNPSYVRGPVWITGNSMVINVDENAEMDKYFLYQNLLSLSLKRFVTGGAQPQLTRNVLDRVPIKTPSLKEQEKIGNFFKQLDETIDLHEQKLETYQELKKAMLQKMFV
ncbi:restriction endonuclease subunit S [Carnobacterium viridans]|nr:restriction endonuclease subunit S [Carnobacterium viridans]